MVAVVVLAVLVAILRVAMGRSFNAAVAVTEMRSVNGRNLGRVLGVLGVATLLTDASAGPALGTPSVYGTGLAVLAVVLVVAMASDSGVAHLVVALLSVGLVVMTRGLAGVVHLALVSACLLWLFGLARGLLP